jgi:DNA-binding MarR family transcriptional regulator
MLESGFESDAGSVRPLDVMPFEIAGILAELKRLERKLEGVRRSITEASTPPSKRKDAARTILAAHRAIDALFDFDGLATSPAWDILLEIHAAGTLATSDAAVGGGCAATTGLRWLAALEDKELVHRFDDARDGRRKLVVLSSRGKELVEAGLKFYDERPRDEGRSLWPVATLRSA